jgi:hypothetical protein
MVYSQRRVEAAYQRACDRFYRRMDALPNGRGSSHADMVANLYSREASRLASRIFDLYRKSMKEN